MPVRLRSGVPENSRMWCIGSATPCRGGNGFDSHHLARQHESRLAGWRVMMSRNSCNYYSYQSYNYNCALFQVSKYMMIRYFIILCLVGCSATMNTIPFNDEAHITWVRFDDPFDLQKQCKDIGVAAKTFYTVEACAYFDLETKQCTIYTLNPRTLYGKDMALVGHEVKHCFDGDFHD